MSPVELLSIGATLALNAGFAWLTGSFFSRIWLGRAHRQLLEQSARRLRLCETFAALVCLGGTLTELWADTAMMGDVPLGQALGMLPQVLTETGFGFSAMVSIVAAALLPLTPHWRKSWALRGVLLLLFALARASMSHAAEHGLLSVAVGIECLHLVMVGVWLGAVALAVCVVLPATCRDPGPLGPYLMQLSRGATVALVGIVASGVFNTWQRIDAPSQFIDGPYGLALTVKLALVGVAVLFGGYNRYIGFPALARDGGGYALLVLRIETLVLLGALAAAAVLTGQAPPG